MAALKTLDWQHLVGRHYAILVKDIGHKLNFTVTSRGFAAVALSTTSRVPDLTISATVCVFLLLLTRLLMSEGDTELGPTVKNLLDALDPEWVLGRLPAPLARAAQRMLAA